MEHIPNELLKYGILLRLPETTVLRFMFTCKRYYDLVSCDPYFAISHRHQRGRKRVLIIGSDPPRSLDCYSLRTTALDLPRIEDIDTKDVRIMGSCNGLICLLFGIKDLVLWNPTTRDFNKLRHTIPLNSTDLFGFGYDTSRCDHNLVFVNSDVIVSYSLRSDSVKVIPASIFIFFTLEGRGVYFSDHLHWFTWTYKNGSKEIILVIAYDLGKETLGLIPLPPLVKIDDFYNGGITVIKDRFSMFCLSPFRPWFEVWVMEEYGVQSSWTKTYKLENFDQWLSTRWILCSRYENELIVETSEDVSLLVASEKREVGIPLVFPYRTSVCEKKEKEEVMWRKRDLMYKYRSWTYVESLVSPHSGGFSLDGLAKMAELTRMSRCSGKGKVREGGISDG